MPFLSFYSLSLYMSGICQFSIIVWLPKFLEKISINSFMNFNGIFYSLQKKSTKKTSPPCAICRKTLKIPYLKCHNDHKVCRSCVTTPSALCPNCDAPINKPCNFTKPKTEINVKIKCKYSIRGCKYLLEPAEVEEHHLECRFRDFICEGDSFDCWHCPWSGRYDQIQDHFKEDHQENTMMQFKTEARMKLDLTEDYRSINLIDYREGQNFFWYKCKVDQKTRMFYSVIQLIGTRHLSEKYCYEFEIVQGPVRKIKVTEICKSDVEDVDQIFEKQKCVAISFDNLNNYLDENNCLRFRFRLMSIKNPQGE